MDEDDFEAFWELQAKSHILLGKLQSLLSRVDLDEERLDEITEIIKDSNETIATCKANIMTMLDI